MKKLLSILLSALILSTAFVIVPSTFVTSNETTYKANSTTYGNGYGTVYRKGNKLFSKVNNKETVLDTIDLDYAGVFMRGKTVYYSSNENKALYTISIDGKNKKKVASNIGTLIGGYGKNAIVQNNKVINKIDTNGTVSKVTTLPSNVNSVSALFNGKIYCSYKSQTSYYVYNLATNKASTLRGKNLVSGKANAFYINNNNLMRIDLNNKVTTLSKGIYKIYGCNDGATVVFSKKDNSNKEIFYRKTSTKMANRLCKTADIEKKLMSIIKKPFNSSKALNRVEKAVITRNNVCFVVSHNQYEDSTDMLLNVNINGGKLNLFERNNGKRIGSINSVGSYVAYEVENTEDFPITYSVKNLK